jgi:hypothetical protein
VFYKLKDIFVMDQQEVVLNDIVVVVSENNGAAIILAAFSKEEGAQYFIDTINADGSEDYYTYMDKFHVDEYVKGKLFYYRVELLLEFDSNFEEIDSKLYIDFLGLRAHEMEILQMPLNSVAVETWGNETKYFVFVQSVKRDLAFALGKNLISDFIKKTCGKRE